MNRTTEDSAPQAAAEGDPTSPVTAAVQRHDTSSVVAVVGHPIHAMTVHFPIALLIGTFVVDMLYWFTADAFWMRVGLWSAGIGFVSGIAAALIGTAELLLVKGIRVRVASWTHAVAAMTLLAIAGANWGLRLVEPGAILPHGLALSALASVFTGLAGWHGGKLIFDHGIGLSVTPDR